MKKDTKVCLKFNLLTFFVLFLFSYSTLFIGKVSAGTETVSPEEVYQFALNIINEKFYFKSRINLDRWENRFNKKIKNLDDAHKRIDKITKELKDPYTRFLTKEQFDDEQSIINSTFIGIGVKLAFEKPVIVEVLENSPASIEGIQPYDYIVSINDKSTKLLNSTEVANLMRGPKDSTLTVGIKRKNKLIQKIVTRQELNFKAVSSKFLDNNIAFIKIESFIPENTSALFRNEISKLMSSDGLILDLRNNSGGLVKNAVEIADMFLNQGKIVSTVNNSTRTNEYANSIQLYKSNIIILVNENTASASEILAGALQENNRAILIGKRTFGKGLVQEIIKLPDDSALHVTIASYLTPNGSNINKIGLTPDEIIYDENIQIKRALEVLNNSNKAERERIASI